MYYSIFRRRLAYWPPQKKPLLPQKRGFETVFSFLFRCPEPRRRTTGNRGYKRGPTFFSSPPPPFLKLPANIFLQRGQPKPKNVIGWKKSSNKYFLRRVLFWENTFLAVLTSLNFSIFPRFLPPPAAAQTHTHRREVGGQRRGEIRINDDPPFPLHSSLIIRVPRFINQQKKKGGLAVVAASFYFVGTLEGGE